MKARIFALIVASVTLATVSLRAESADQVIARARTWLGSEKALNAVTAIHFTGTLETTAKVPSAEDKTKLVDRVLKLPVEIIFQKDYHQLITVTDAKVIESTALDGYDAWQKRTNPANPTQWQVTLLDANQVKRLRANTWENLSFFAGLERKGGTLQLGGEVTVDGVPCVKLAFIHAENIVFQRYFDKATGRLIKTETENGGEIREEGETVVNGVRFPRKVINKGANGLVTTITFDTVVLNEPLPASLFAVPTLQPR